MIDTSRRTAYDADLNAFRDQVRKFYAQHLTPNLARWEKEGIVDKDFWRAAGEAGLLCPNVAEADGGLGLDIRYNAVIIEELAYQGSGAGLSVHSDIVCHYIMNYGSAAQKKHYLPKMISGELIGAIAMTEPGAGSDLQGVQTTAKRDGDHYVINGSKTYITNGQNCGFTVVVAKTNPNEGARGISLIIVDEDAPGFIRGRNLDKIGQHSGDTSELFFQDCRVPVSNCLGAEGQGFIYLMSQLPQERLVIAVQGMGAAQRAYDEAVNFVRERKAFGKPILDFQNTRFTLAGMKAKLQVGWAHLDYCITRHVNGELDAYEGAAAKLWTTEMQWEITDAALQLHGGAGYMNEYAIAQFWRDARVQRIYGGTSEIMRELIGRSI